MDSYYFLKWFFLLGFVASVVVVFFVIVTETPIEYLVIIGIWITAVALLAQRENQKMGTEQPGDKWKKDFDITIKDEVEFDILIKENGDE